VAPTSWQEWVAWAGIVVPLAALAWAAVFYTLSHRRDTQHRRFDRFFSVTDKIGQEGGSIMSKVAALYELRRFPEYSEVIVRMTENPDIRGAGRPKEILENEFKLTHDAMKEIQ
jgi:hypothetical protein